MSQSSAHYGPLPRMGWLERWPQDRELLFEVGALVPEDWREIVIDRKMASGVGITIDRRGFAIYDFAEWPLGLSRPIRSSASKSLLFTFGESSEGAKRAVIHRLRVMNTHLSLLHAASMHLHDESPAVTRIYERDLFRFEYPDEGGDGYWYVPFSGRLPNRITDYDRERPGTVSREALDLSIDWLDVVVANQVLLEFDLLNQTQDSVVAHDYGLAVSSGWTVCELQLRARVRTTPSLGISPKQTIHRICTQLESQGILDQALAGRLSSLRIQRNSWLHSGVEPNEETALESLRLATATLRRVIPDLDVRAERGLLVL